MAEVEEMEKLPEGWKRIRLGEVSKIVKGITYKSSDYSESEEGAIFINLKCILKSGGFNKEGLKYYKGHIGESQILRKDDVIIAIVDLTRDGDIIGYPLRVPDFDPNKVVSMSMDVVKIEPDAQIDKVFLYYRLCLDDIHSYMLSISAGSTVLHLDLNWLPQLELSIPSSPHEQRKIAEILETVDNAIEKTDRIIEKYKRIKQALMQDLLTKGIDKNGRIRSEETHRFKDSPLGRIPEEWEVVELGEVLSFKNGKSPQIIDGGTYPIYGSNGLIGFTNDYFLDGVFLLVGRVGASGETHLVSGKLWASDNCLIGECNSDITPIFIYYLLKYLDLKKFITQTAQPLITQSFISKLQIILPPSPEQHHIASILSQIDETIEKEQKYKEKLERIKQGLMEDLLTGKVRVNHLIDEVKK